jgi:hypothetical protein
MSIRFVGAPSVALCYDSKHDTVVKVSRATDDQGRAYEQYDDGPWVPIPMPDEPDVGPIATG